MVQSRKKKSAAGEDPKIKHALTPTSSEPAAAEDAGGGHKSFESLVSEVEDYAIFLLDESGKILSWNRGGEKIKGYTANEIIGRNYRMFYTEEDRDEKRSEKMLDEARTNGRASYEGWRVRKDGTRFWGSVTLTALHSEKGRVGGFLKVTRDLTDKKIAEDNYSNFVEDLKLQNEELRRSEERYRKMISEVVDYAIVLLDKDGTILDWNKGAEKLKGYTSKEILGKNFRMFHPREEKESGVPERLLAEALEKDSVTQEGWRIKKDGKRFWGSVSITALHDSEGRVIGFSKVTRDLTDKKVAQDRVSIVLEELRQANEQLKQSEERYHLMIAEVRDYAIILLSPTGQIENWNAGAEYIKGYKGHEVIGKNFRIFYTEDDRKRKLPESLLQYARQNGRASHEGWRVRKDGTRFWGSIVITALHSASGDIIGFSKVTRDLTEKKNADDILNTNAAQLDLKNKTLERLNEELSSFTHVASHDMKEPLRKIQTNVARIESANFDPAKSREFIEKIKASASGMQKLIDDLLSYSQVSSNATTNFERIDLNKVVKSAVSDLEASVQEKQAVFEIDRLPVIPGIHYQLYQLFLNLLSNAVKFSKQGEPPRVTVRTETIKGPEIPGDIAGSGVKYHHITVADNGIGFSQQQADRIFEAFHRLHPRSAFSGTGIGLAIVKKIIENHNGIITAEGEPGVGATFHLYLPVG